MPSIINSDDGVVSGTSGLKTTGGNDGALNIQYNGNTALSISASGVVAINSNNISADNSLGFRNRIINGAMMIDQRNAGAAVTVNAASQVFAVDRFRGYGQATDGVFTMQQNSSAPAGFVNSLKVTVTTADASVGSSQYYFLSQLIEGTNCSDLAFGSASAKTVTLSFWVRSSVTGTFGGSITNSAFDRSYPFTYSISSADTWEQKTISIAGDTTGTWLTTTGIGIGVYWDFGSGSSNIGTANSWANAGYVGATGGTKLISTLNATWYITGVQLEVGSVATPFERRPYGTELMLCQRYYYRYTAGATDRTIAVGGWTGTTAGWAVMQFPVTMRTRPTAVEQTGTAGHYSVFEATGGGRLLSTVPAFYAYTTEANGAVSFTTSAGGTAGAATNLYSSNASAYLGWSAEL